MQHADSILETGDDGGTRGMLGADQVAHDLSGVGLAKIRGKTLSRVLIDRAKDVFPTVGAREVEHLRLHRATTHCRSQATRITGERQDGDADRSRPERAIVVAEEKTSCGAGGVTGVRDDRDTVRPIHRRSGTDDLRGNAAMRCDEEADRDYS
jgi:hypothetical protein